jgi:hypothetical protein
MLTDDIFTKVLFRLQAINQLKMKGPLLSGSEQSLTLPRVLLQTGRHRVGQLVRPIIGTIIIKRVFHKADGEFFINQINTATAALRQFVFQGERDAVLAGAEFFGGHHMK